MSISKPEDAHRLFVEAFNAGNSDALAALYEPDAQLVPQPGQVAQGRDAIRSALGEFLALKGKISIETKHCLQNGDLGLLRGHWQVKGTGPDGKPVELSGKSAELVRRQPDGSWRYVIDHPFGAD